MVNAQMLKGKVTEYGEDGTLKPILGATLQWMGTNIGAVSDGNGSFEIPKTVTSQKLIVQYLSYENDTIEIHKDQVLLNVFLSFYTNYHHRRAP